MGNVYGWLLVLAMLLAVAAVVTGSVSLSCTDKNRVGLHLPATIRRATPTLVQDIISPVVDSKKSLFLTYKNFSSVPKRVFDNLKALAPDWNIYFFDDDACLSFLDTTYGDQVLQRYASLRKGAHRADLFRYCVLYRFGGMYADIKVEFKKPLDEWVARAGGRNFTVLSKIPKTIFQGIVYCDKQSPVILQCISHMLRTPAHKYASHYLLATKQFYDELQVGSPKPLKAGATSPGWYLYEEKALKCVNEQSDFRGACHKILDADGTLMANTRYSDFGRAW